MVNFSRLVLVAMAGIGPASAFVAPPSEVHSHANNQVTSLAAVETMAMGVDTTVIAGVGAALSAIGGVAVAFGKRVGGNTPSISVTKPAEPEVIDVSIPYDAAAKLAYDSYAKSSSKKVNFEQFQSLYYEQMVAEVKATVQERKVNEMKAILAGMESEASAIQGQIAELFGASPSAVAAKAPAPTVVKAETTSAASANDSDLTIDYNGAARLAYASSDKSMDFESFRKVYETETVAMVAAKNPYKK